jgi:eukaryotic-like serine/threonine-protein kinase
MAIQLATTICSICGEPLNAKGDCLACLLRTGLDESVSETEPLASSVFGDFEIVSREDGSFWELGHGAMGMTYLAVDNVLRRKVALKVIDVPSAARGSHVRERFLREARAAAALRHPNVAAVFQFGASPDGSHCYYAMELVEGETLETRVRRDGPLNARLALEIAIQITRALMAAAAHGLIHRDLKPGNIMLTSGNAATTELEVKVIDFGLAKAIADAGGEMDLTHGEFVGTPNFASPEQFGSGPVDVRSDIYSLGATLWFALIGKTPFAGRSVEEIQRAQQSGAFPIGQLKAAHVPSRLRSLLKSMLAFEPAARPGIQELAASLRRCSVQASGVRRNRIALAAAVILILGISSGIYSSRQRTASHMRGLSARAMLAVLPFENLTGDPDQELFTDGLTEETISQLGHLQPERLGVIARTSAVQYKRTKKSVREIGHELGVNYVLEGSVRPAGSKVRISAQLIQVSDQTPLFAANYERDSRDTVALQEETAQAVSKEVGSKLNLAYRMSPPSAQGINPEAYEAYLRGCRYFDDLEFDKSIDYLSQAIKLAPNYAAPYAKLAVVYSELAFFNMLPPSLAFGRMRNAALQALEKDNTLSTAHGALALVKLHYDLDFAGAENEFKRALELNPNDAAVRHDYSHYLMAMGRVADSAAETAKAVALDPVSMDLISCLCWHRYAVREYDESIAQAQKAIQLAPDIDWTHTILGWDYEQKGKFQDAINELQKAVKLSKDSEYAIAALGHAYAIAGKKEELREVLEKLRGISDRGYVSAFDMAVIHAGLGDKDEAFHWLERAYEERSSFLVYSRWEPRLDPLRSDPRFQELLHRIGLSSSNAAVTEKSIAVLPFENLSRDPDNAFFADGVQDELLTDLARIADLRVISRTSVMQYKSGVARNLRQIARELGVANILEGTVQRAGDRVRVSAQLLDARNDVHLWAEHYDRPLGDVFAIQSEIAKAIADQLRAKLSPTEKAAIERPPTADLAAFDLYTRAKTLTLQLSYIGARSKDNVLQAIELLNHAVERDPKFLLAYDRLAYANDFLYIANQDHTPARRALADAAVQKVLHLQPDSGAAHLALAQHLYSCYLDFDHASRELATAQRMLPNSPQVFEVAGIMDRRRGRWEESVRDFERALQFDPRNVSFFHQMSISYQCLRRYEQMAAVLDRALDLFPRDVATRQARARVDIEWHADTKPLHRVIEAILAEDPAATPLVANSWLYLALYERDLGAGDRALVALSDNPFVLSPNIYLNHAFAEGLIARMRGDTVAARAAFTAARTQQEDIVRTQPDYAVAVSVLGLIDAGLGRKDEALREGRRAIELLPVARDAFAGPDLIQLFSIICAWTGEKDFACEQLATAARLPSYLLTYGRLRLLPFWDPLSGDPRFEKIVASLAPKSN